MVGHGRGKQGATEAVGIGRQYALMDAAVTQFVLILLLIFTGAASTASSSSTNGTCYSYTVDGINFGECQTEVSNAVAKYPAITFDVPHCAGRLVEVRNRLLAENEHIDIASLAGDATILRKMFVDGELGCMRDCNGQCFDDGDCKLGTNGKQHESFAVVELETSMFISTTHKHARNSQDNQ